MPELMNGHCDPRLVWRLRTFTAFTALFTAAIGACGLAGWVFNVSQLKTVLPGMVTMKANTAICLLLISSAFWLLTKTGEPTRWTIYVARSAAVLAAMVGSLSLLEYVFHWNFGIDQLLFVEPLYSAAVPGRPGLMSPVAAVDFFLLGTILLFVDPRTKRSWPP